MIPINSAIESLLHQKKRRRALLLQLNLHALLQFIQLTSRESWVQNEVGGQIQPLTPHGADALMPAPRRSISSAICLLDRVVVPSFSMAAVRFARPGISAGSL